MVSKPEAQPSSISQAAEERIRVAIHLEYPEQTIAIGSTLIEDGRNALCELLRRNLDIFSWKPKDMKRVPRHLAEHRLNFREGCIPVRQKKRSQAPKRNKEIQEEVAKTLDTEIMKEVHYHSWLSNPVMMCVRTAQLLSERACSICTVLLYCVEQRLLDALGLLLFLCFVMSPISPWLYGLVVLQRCPLIQREAEEELLDP
ncbi:hypothetical protein Tco_0268465 [Tanacetum coccineum]